MYYLSKKFQTKNTMKNLTKILLSIYVAIMMVAVACKKDEPTPLSSEKVISNFSFSSLNPAVIGSITGTNVTATLPFGTNLNLAPTITVSAKATVSPSSGSSQDFSKSVSYILTAEDGSKQTYNVAVSLGKSPEKDILTFAFNGITPAVACTIDAATKTISATLPAGTDATKLMPTITNSPKATVSPATGVAQDFTKTVTYTVTAEDATTQTYTTKITVVDNGTLYIGNYDGVFFALDPLTGAKKWQVQMPDGISSAATYADGLVYISCWNKKIYALDATSGTKKWEFLHGKSNDFSAPMVVNGLIYLGGGTKIYCLDASSGVKKWEFEGDGIYDWQASPTVIGGVVFGIIRGNSGGKYGMYALDAITGAKKWGPKTDVYLSESSPAVANGIVYAGSELNGFVAMDASNGTTKWTYRTGDVIVNSSPAVSNGIVYIGSWDKKLHALDATTGIKKWTFQTDGWVNNSPIVSNGIVYFGSNDNKLYALDATTGVKKWEVMPQQFEWVESSPVIFNGLIYVGVGKSVYAYDATTGTQKWSFLSGRSFGKATACIVDKDGKVYHSGLSGTVQ
jgi:eukaryotic-like serine/threonine-protein kinase